MAPTWKRPWGSSEPPMNVTTIGAHTLASIACHWASVGPVTV